MHKRSLSGLGLTQQKLSRNGNDLLSSLAANWIGPLGSVQVQPCGYSVDHAHFEGGYAMFQIGMTLSGRRRLILQRRDDSDVEIPMDTGDFYIGNLSSAKHYYRYPHMAGDMKVVLFVKVE